VWRWIDEDNKQIHLLSELRVRLGTELQNSSSLLSVSSNPMQFKLAPVSPEI
jgi:hypothetical protein